MILLDIGKCVAVRIFRHRQIQAVHRELREPEAFVCRVGNGFFPLRGKLPALGHRAMLRRGSGNREQIRHPGAVELHVPSTICLCYVYNRNKFPRICLAEALWFIDGDIVGKSQNQPCRPQAVFSASEYVWIKFPIPRCIVSGKKKRDRRKHRDPESFPCKNRRDTCPSHPPPEVRHRGV